MDLWEWVRSATGSFTMSAAHEQVRVREGKPECGEGVNVAVF
jgi:hypothetical protein